MARDRISQEQYLSLRDQDVRMRRGIEDLLRAPGARSLAVRRMELQENFLRLATQALNPFSGLIQLAAPSWTPLGPAPIPNGQTTAVQVPVSGRVTAIVVDPTTTQTVYVGTAQGGVYRSTDGGASWTALLDSAQSLAIGALALDPQNPNTLFVGTGEGNLSGDSFFGVGLYIVTNASTATPTVSGPFNSDGLGDVFTGRAITKIIVNPADSNKILVSTASGASGLSADAFGTLPTRGVYLSTNALVGTPPTFSRVTIQTGNINRTVTDMVMDPGNASKILVWVFGLNAANDGGLYVSTAGDPWANTATWTQTITRQGFGKLAVNRSGAPAATTFLIAQDETVTCGINNTQGTLRTSADGITWSAQLTAANGFCGGQCFYDMVPAFDPGTAATIYIGGSSDGACSRVLAKSTNGGTSFSSIDGSLHADFHALAFAPSNPSVIYSGNDGGVFRSADSGATWSSINTAGFNATQFVSLSLHPTDGNFTIGGTQDNGTEFMKPDGTWTRADFGDGGYSAIDQSATDTTNVNMYHTYFNSSGGLIGFARTLPATATDNGWTFLGCNGVNGNGITCADAVLFYAPLALGPGTPNTVYFGTDHLYRSINQGTNNTAASQVFAPAVPTAVPVSAIGVSPQDDNVRLVGLANGKVFATTAGANPMTDITGPSLPGKFVARAVIDPNNKSTAYLTFDGYGTPAAPVAHVWKTTNLANEPPTATWSSAANGLPDVPVNAFAVDPFNPAYLYAGTDIGVFSSIDGGANWAAYGTGLPRVAVFDLNIQKSSHKIRIGTHGRGAWEIGASLFTNTTSLGADATTPTLGQNVTFTATVNQGTGINIPTGTVTFEEGATVLGTGTVDGTGKATFATTALALGPHNITAVYGGDTLYLSSTSSALAVTVTAAGATATTTGIATSSNSSVFGAAIDLTATVTHSTGAAAPTGTVTFNDGVTVLGSTSVNAQGSAVLHISTLGVGNHSITAAYGGDANYAASTSTAVAVNVLAATTLSLTASSTNPVSGTNVTFTATLTTTGSLSVPTGQITYKDGTASIGTSAFLDSSVTSFQISTLAVGPHTITAEYAGDTVHAAAISSAVVVTVGTVPPDYQVSVPNGSATIAAGQSATYTISINPQGGFNGTVTFACSGLPSASSCSFNPPSLTPNGTTASTTLTLSTTARSVASAQPTGGMTLAALASFGFVGVVLLGSARRRKRTVRLVSGLLGTLAFGCIISCGGGGGKPPTITGTPAGTYSVTVSATSGATTHSSVITLTVQ
ncbi:MAG TPA: Ig-like domain repeat protein [Candidatus Angelobacter sp.]|nr:Ig-like domain repeat protein [Candidatus Angelobacter sp.]